MRLIDYIFKRQREPTQEPKEETTRLEMMSVSGGFFSFGGDLYASDLVQSAIRPYTRHVGKLIAKHFRGRDVNPDPTIRFLLEEPNSMMTMQKLIERTVWCLKLNGNAFIYIQQQHGMITGLFPLSPVAVDALGDKQDEIYLKFHFANGKSQVIPYTHIIHLRENFNEHDLFGDNPAVALLEVMETICITEQGIKHAIKNSTLIRWLLRISNSIRPEDVEKKTREVKEKFLSPDSDFGGIVGLDTKYDLQQVKNENQLYIPDNHVQNTFIERVHNFFGVNKKIIQNTFNEEEFSSWFESEIQPIATELSDEFTRKIFSKRERSFGNKIVFDTANLIFASNRTKLGLVSLLDRGVLSINEFRDILNFEPLAEDKFIIRREYGGLNEVVSRNAEGGDEDEEREQPETTPADPKFNND